MQQSFRQLFAPGDAGGECPVIERGDDQGREGKRANTLCRLVHWRRDVKRRLREGFFELCRLLGIGRHRHGHLVVDKHRRMEPGEFGCLHEFRVSLDFVEALGPFVRIGFGQMGCRAVDEAGDILPALGAAGFMGLFDAELNRLTPAIAAQFGLARALVGLVPKDGAGGDAERQRRD